jgi:hypothetical protein
MEKALSGVLWRDGVRDKKTNVIELKALVWKARRN